MKNTTNPLLLVQNKTLDNRLIAASENLPSLLRPDAISLRSPLLRELKSRAIGEVPPKENGTSVTSCDSGRVVEVEMIEEMDPR